MGYRVAKNRQSFEIIKSVVGQTHLQRKKQLEKELVVKSLEKQRAAKLLQGLNRPRVRTDFLPRLITLAKLSPSHSRHSHRNKAGSRSSSRQNRRTGSRSRSPRADKRSSSRDRIEKQSRRDSGASSLSKSIEAAVQKFIDEKDSIPSTTSKEEIKECCHRIKFEAEKILTLLQ